MDGHSSIGDKPDGHRPFGVNPERLGCTWLVHADWSVQARKRWAAWASFSIGRWRVEELEPVGDLHGFNQRLLGMGASEAVVAGFDFPIGLPSFYGAKTGASDFPSFLQGLDQVRWERFASVTDDPAEISLDRPFFPLRSRKGVRRASLVEALGVASFDALLRSCERSTPTRRAACPLFWTLGGAQVGRAALSGWEGVVRPMLSEGARLWPFHGRLIESCSSPGVVIAETYPAEAYNHVGVAFGPRQSKRRQADRMLQADRIIEWSVRRGVGMAPAVAEAVSDGFGSSADGEDRFDALLGLLGMIEVASGCRSEGGGSREVAHWEGWILGQGPPLRDDRAA